MVFLLMALALSDSVALQQAGVKTLTDRNFEKIVDKRDNNSVIIVMFHGDYCPACKACYPAYMAAAKQMKGVATFAHLDCSRNPRISRRFGIRTIPNFIIFHPNGTDSFMSLFRSESNFIKGVLKYIPNTVEKATESWETSGKSAVLLTGKWSMPSVWKSVAWKLADKGVKFGWANDKTTKKAFDVAGEAIVLFNNGQKTVIQERNPTFANLKASIENWIEGKEEVAAETVDREL